MTIAEIENLSHADLKAQRGALVQAAQELPVAEVAARYVQARTDAKGRDEKLFEQGQTITALQAGYAALQEKAAASEVEISELKAQLQDALKVVSDHTKALQDAKQQIGVEMMRADKAEKLAKARRTILAKIMQDVSPVLAEEA